MSSGDLAARQVAHLPAGVEVVVRDNAVTMPRASHRHGTLLMQNRPPRRSEKNPSSSQKRAEHRPGFKRIDASRARYDDGAWLEARR
jgi:hypothetical protein